MTRSPKKAPRRVREAAPAYRPEPAQRLLLDTNAWIWWKASDRKLGARARRAIQSAAQVYVSVATVWEMSIKAARGKLRLPPNVDVSAEIAVDGFAPLSIGVDHAARAGSLPLFHSDPFDRMLVAQANVEELTIVTSDAAIARYPVPVLDARS